MPDEAQELAACQRYWSKATVSYCGDITAGTTYHGFGVYPQPMRVDPALSGVHVAANGFGGTVGVLTNSYVGVMNEYRTSTTNAAGLFITTMTANAGTASCGRRLSPGLRSSSTLATLRRAAP
jgi:hypothetical protein